MDSGKITLIIIACCVAGIASASFGLGYTVGREDVLRDAKEHGVLIMERGVAGQKNYRWIETHKLGYDYDE